MPYYSPKIPPHPFDPNTPLPAGVRLHKTLVAIGSALETSAFVCLLALACPIVVVLALAIVPMRCLLLWAGELEE